MVPFSTSPLIADEADLIRRAARHEEAAARAIIQQHNRRLFRVARSLLRDDGEAEDALQEAYLKAFASLRSFRGESSLSTWLTRIVVNESLQRMRGRKMVLIEDTAMPIDEQPENVVQFPVAGQSPLDPERSVAQREITRLLERAIDSLPDDFRTVLVMRTIEGMSIEETAELLGIKPETVKTRLFRARSLLKDALADHVDSLMTDVFPFAGARCDRITEKVIARLKETR